MPFLHYETDERRRKLSRAIKSVREHTQQIDPPNRDSLLIQAYLNSTPPLLHPRRTLDQFFYHGIDTTARDTDQYVPEFFSHYANSLWTNRYRIPLGDDCCSPAITNSQFLTGSYTDFVRDTRLRRRYSWSINFGSGLLGKVPSCTLTLAAGVSSQFFRSRHHVFPPALGSTQKRPIECFGWYH